MCARREGTKGGKGEWERGREKGQQALLAACCVRYLLEEVVAHRNQQLLLSPESLSAGAFPFSSLSFSGTRSDMTPASTAHSRER